MKEAGYEWNAEKKELKKIEQKPAENEELTEFDKAVSVSIGTWNPKTPEQIRAVKAVSEKLLKLAKKQINNEQKPAWSEEDETTKNNISHIIRQYDKISKRENQPCYYVGDCLLWMQNIKDRVQPQLKQEWSKDDEAIWAEIADLLWEGYKQSGSKFTWDDIRNWLNPKIKSLKDRVQPQPKQWSEEDKKMLGMCIDAASGYYSPEDKQSMKDWLYSLKDRYTWKPSDEQMNALNDVISSRDIKYDVLSELWKDLKKLREE